MATRMFFIVKDGKVLEKTIEFKYYSGFAISQKQKSVISLHDEIRKIFDGNILEVSSKSLNNLGKNLSAFNLKVDVDGTNVSIENIFQASKVFEYGGPYLDLLKVSPIDAKKDDRIKNSGRLISFEFKDKQYPINPTTAFYDWLYCCALYRNFNLVDEATKYDIFTDIEFNHEKSLNCQARSLGIFVALYKTGKIDAIKHFETFVEYVYTNVYSSISTGIFE